MTLLENIYLNEIMPKEVFDNIMNTDHNRPEDNFKQIR